MSPDRREGRNISIASPLTKTLVFALTPLTDFGKLKSPQYQFPALREPMRPGPLDRAFAFLRLESRITGQFAASVAVTQANPCQLQTTIRCLGGNRPNTGHRHRMVPNTIAPAGYNTRQPGDWTDGNRPMSDTWQTYVQAAKALGLSVEGVRQRARREMWRKQLGNDGKARIIIPADTTSPPPHEAAGNQKIERPSNKRLPDGPTAGEITALQARISDLQEELSRSRNDVEREREERWQERNRADRLASELAEMSKRMADAAGAKDDTTRRLQNVENTLAEMRARPWWRRFVG